MFGKILFATTAKPNSDNAAKVAFDLAYKNEARLYLFHVLGVPTRGFSQVVTDLKSGDADVADADYRAWVEEELNSVYAAQLEGMPDDGVVRQLAVGVPATEILRFARQEGVDLIIMGAHNREDDDSASSRVRAVIGNTMEKVARQARCPVLIVNRPCTTCWRLFSNIIFCTDFSRAADSAFQFAYNTAREVGAKLYLFHAFDISNALTGVFAGQAEIERQVEKARQKMQEKYLSRMGDYDNYQVEIWEGTPYVEILKYARDKQADLVVMAHHTKESDKPEDAEIGSTVEQVVLRSACPVASVNRSDKLEAVNA
jgi:nucleotide-binding universal stress UspA family protein